MLGTKITAAAGKTENLIAFRYEALNPKGKLVKGNVKAANEIAAERALIDRGLNPQHVEVAPSMFSLEEALPTLFKVKPRDVIIFSRQLATLLKSGISLLPALEILQGQVAISRAFKKVLTSVVNDIRAGNSFSEAISKHPRVFNGIYAKSIAVGEGTGNLESVLHRVASFLERQTATSKKISRALAYPMMVLGVGLVVVVVLMVVVMPQLMGMFTSMNVELPLPTRILLKATGFLTSVNQLYLLVGIALIVALALWLVKQPSGRRILDRWRLNAPIIGPPTLMGELARFTRTIAVSVSAGVSLQEILEMAPRASNNAIFRDALKQVHEGLLLGEGLSQPMQRLPIFPPLLVQMVAVGEESNTLDFTMGVVADFYETSADERVAAMVGLIGPLSTMFIALFVGFLAISIIMPIYQLTGAFG